MKKLILLSTILLFSCGRKEENNYGNKTTTFVVSSINYKNKNFATYRIVTTDTTDLNVDNTWILDSIGKFKVGDTLTFNKIKNDK